MVPAVVKVSALEDYLLSIGFEDGVDGILDMRPYLDFGVFRQLRDRANFLAVRVAFDTIEWECGADLDPEFVYRHRQIASNA